MINLSECVFELDLNNNGEYINFNLPINNLDNLSIDYFGNSDNNTYGLFFRVDLNKQTLPLLSMGGQDISWRWQAPGIMLIHDKVKCDSVDLYARRRDKKMRIRFGAEGAYPPDIIEIETDFN